MEERKNEPNAKDAKKAAKLRVRPPRFESLAEIIVQKRAMVYVGTGVSLSTKADPAIPSWLDLIKRLAKKARANFLDSDPEAADYLDYLIKTGDYLGAADLIKEVLDNDLPGELWRSFNHPTEPSDIHYAIARIPFGVTLTTNYERLLEIAYGARRTVLTWQDPAATLAAVIQSWPTILKIHGSIGNAPSIVLSGSEYWNQMFSYTRYRVTL